MPWSLIRSAPSELMLNSVVPAITPLIVTSAATWSPEGLEVKSNVPSKRKPLLTSGPNKSVPSIKTAIVAGAMSLPNTYVAGPTAIVYPAAIVVVGPVTWTKALRRMNCPTEPRSTCSVPSFSSKANIAVPLSRPAIRPKLAFLSSTNTEGLTDSRAVTLLATTLIRVSDLLKPRSPVRVRTPPTLALKPLTAKAIVFAAMALSNV